MSINAIEKEAENTQSHTKIEPLNPRLEEISSPERIFNIASKKPTGSKAQNYLAIKRISLEESQGVRFGKYYDNPAILVPIKGLNGEIKSIQYIFEKSKGKFEKRFHKNADKSGGFFALDQINGDETIFVVEGFATGVSLKRILAQSEKVENTKVVCAFTAQDIPNVAQILKERFQYSEIIAAPDADEAGNKAAKECKSLGVYSIFPPMYEKGTDWNDVLRLGKESAAEEFNKSLSLKGSDDQLEIASKSIPEIENILNNLNEDPFKDFSLKNFPPVLREYIESICETTEAHPIMITMSVLSMISSFVGTRAYIPRGTFFQTLYPNIWSLCINKSGGFKTTALNKGSEIAITKDREILKCIKEMEKEFEEKKILKKSTPEDVEAFERRVLDEELKSPMLPNRQTTEFLMKHLSQGHEGMVMASELGEWLRNMDKSHNGDLKQIFTLFYDCDIPPYRYCTKSSGSYTIDKPFITINAVSTVDWIQSHVKSDDVFSGFFARFLLFTPPYKETIPPALPIHQKESDEASRRKIMETLENMDEVKEFSIPEAVKLQYDNIHASIYKMVQANKKYDDRCQTFLEPYLKRWSPYVLKIAMLLRIIEDPFSNELSETSLKGASEIIRVGIKSTTKLFEKELGESSDQRKQRKVYEWIVRRSRESKRTKFFDFLKSKILDGGSKEYEDVLETLINSGKVDCINPQIKQKKEREYKISQEKVRNVPTI